MEIAENKNMSYFAHRFFFFFAWGLTIFIISSIFFECYIKTELGTTQSSAVIKKMFM